MPTTTIKQSGLFPQSPHAIYEIWLDGKQHTVLTGGPAKIVRRVNGGFTTFGGWATSEAGVN